MLSVTIIKWIMSLIILNNRTLTTCSSNDCMMSVSVRCTITKTFQCNKERFLALKLKKIQLKIVDIFLIFAQNIDCGYTLEPPRRGGSNEYQQSMFWNKNKKNRYTPVYPIFAI